MYIPLGVLAVLFLFSPATAIDLAVIYLAFLFPAVVIPIVIVGIIIYAVFNE